MDRLKASPLLRALLFAVVAAGPVWIMYDAATRLDAIDTGRDLSAFFLAPAAALLFAFLSVLSLVEAAAGRPAAERVGRLTQWPLLAVAVAATAFVLPKVNAQRTHRFRTTGPVTEVVGGPVIIRSGRLRPRAVAVLRLDRDPGAAQRPTFNVIDDGAPPMRPLAGASATCFRQPLDGLSLSTRHLIAHVHRDIVVTVVPYHLKRGKPELLPSSPQLARVVRGDPRLRGPAARGVLRRIGCERR